MIPFFKPVKNLTLIQGLGRFGIDRRFTRCIEGNIKSTTFADEVDGIRGPVVVQFSDAGKIILTAVEDKAAARFDQIA